MKTERRWIQSIVKTSEIHSVTMPWERGARIRISTAQSMGSPTVRSLSRV
jgi:hypothetical protein